MIIVNTKTILKDLKGQDLKDNNNLPILTGAIFVNVLSAITSNPTLAWQLGKKFATEDKVELKAEEVVFLKMEIEKVATGDRAWLASMVAGQILELLDK